jgi:hypothetical protein
LSDHIPHLMFHGIKAPGVPKMSQSKTPSAAPPLVSSATKPRWHTSTLLQMYSVFLEGFATATAPAAIVLVSLDFDRRRWLLNPSSSPIILSGEVTGRQRQLPKTRIALISKQTPVWLR